MDLIKIYIISFFLFNSVLLNAQSPIEISVNLQPGISHEAIDNEVYNITTVPASFAFRGGLEGTYFINDTWGVRLGINILTTRYHEESIFSMFNESTTIKTPISIYYLSTPLQAVYKLPSKKIGINLMTGLQYNIYLGSKDNTLFNVQKYPWYKKGYVSSNVGLEFYKALNSKLSLSIGFTVDIPFTNFLEENDGIAQLNNKSLLWQVFVPLKLTYQLKK